MSLVESDFNPSQLTSEAETKESYYQTCLKTFQTLMNDLQYPLSFETIQNILREEKADEEEEISY